MPLRDMNREQMWLLPPMLDDLLALDHPARFVAEFVDALDRKAWAELGVEIEGDPLGAPAYHPRALLSVWLYGFMTGVRSSRKLEVACRDQIPFLWLTGWQQPDHNTLWRFYRCHRQGMRDLFKRTVRTAVAMELVDLTVQAVDGTRLAANAAADQSYTGEKLEQLLERVDEAIEELESQNEGGEDGATVRLPDQLTNRKALRQRVKQAIEELSGRDRPNRYKRPNRINLTDMDARLVKTGYGVVPGYNAQAMVSPVELEGKEAGMLITAADVVDKSYDNGMLVPMMEKAEEATGTKVPMTLADSGYFAGSELEECAQRGQKVVVPEVHQKTVDHPYHKDRFIYDETTDTYTWPTRAVPALRPTPIRQQGMESSIPVTKSRLPEVSGQKNVYLGWPEGSEDSHRTSRLSSASPPGMDVHRRSQTRVSAEKVSGRTGLRNHQGTDGSPEIPVEGFAQRDGRVGCPSHCLQPAHPLESVALWPVHFPTDRPWVSFT